MGLKRVLALALACGVLALGAPGAGRADEPPKPPPALSKAPKLLKYVQAPSPASLAEKGAVDVLLDIDVDDKGKVSQVVVTRSGGAEYDEAASGAAKQFEFSPGEFEGKPVPVRISFRYRFFMKPAEPPPPPPTAVEKPVTEAAAPAAVPSVPFDGRVLRRGERTPIIGATVTLDGGDLTATSDDEGHFAFDAVPVGKHKVFVRAGGYDDLDTEETFNAGKRLTATYYTFAKARYRSIVKSQRVKKETVEQTLDIDEIRRIPGTQGDTLKAVQNLPGVARAPFGLGQLIVWGSRPADTRVYVDGTFIPTLYHFGGLRSTVNGDVVQSLTFTPGGYGAEWGRGLGGIVEVETRKPRTDGYHGYGQIDIIDGSFLVEGPISKNVSFGVSARRSWIDVFLPIFTTNQFQLSPKYWDYQARLHWKASPRDEVDVFLFGSDDAIEVQTKNPNPQLSAAFNTHTYYHTLLARYQHRFENGGTLSFTPSVGYSVPFQLSVAVGTFGFSVDTRSCPYSLRTVLRYPLASFLRLDAGLDFEGDRYGITANSPASGQPTEDRAPPMSFGLGNLNGKGSVWVNTLAPWAALSFSLFDKHLTVVPQLRLDLYGLSGDYKFDGAPAQVPQNLVDANFSHAYMNVEPRLAVRYEFNKYVAIKGSIGGYHQAPAVSALFGPFGNPDLKPEYAIHYVAGVEVKPYSSLYISADGFYKDLRDTVVSNATGGFPTLVNEGIGRVYGGELLVRQQLYKGLFGWVSYTISRSERKDHSDSPDWRLFQYDQTHILTAIASYQFGRGYQVGLRFRYVTGNPFTPNSGAYVDLNAGRYTPVRAPLYSGRLDPFNQLDVRFDKQWTFDRWAFSVYLDIQNVYNAHNPEGIQSNYDYTLTAPVSGLPLLPALGVRGDF